MNLPDLTQIPEQILKFVEEYWQYWWVLLLAVIGLGVYIIWVN
jgi:hypothetical protein